MSVVLLCRNQQPNLPRIVASLQRQSERPSEVIVVDDRSQTQACSLATTLGCEYVSTGSHVAFERSGLRSLSRQIGTDHAKGGLLLYLDGDMLPSRRLIEFATASLRPTAVLKAPRRFLLSEDGNVIQNAPLATGILARRRINWTEFSSDCFFVHRETVHAIGGWDENFEGWGEEDIEFGYRLEEARIVIEEIQHRSLFATHMNHSVDHVQNFSSLRRNAAHFVQKHPEMAELRNDYWASMGVYLREYRQGWPLWW